MNPVKPARYCLHFVPLPLSLTLKLLRLLPPCHTNTRLSTTTALHLCTHLPRPSPEIPHRAGTSSAVPPKNTSWEVQWLAGGNGDGSLTYPGRPDRIGGTSTIPIASLRLKQIRDGLQDLEYMYLLEDATGSSAAAMAIVDSVVRTTYDFELDPSAMLAARAKLAAAIEAAMG